MNGFFSKIKFTSVCAVTLISILVFGCISVCIFAAAPESEEVYYTLPSSASDALKIAAPTLLPETLLVEPETWEAEQPEVVRVTAGAIKAAAPETLPETDAPETEPIVPETEPAAVPETELTIIPEPEPEPEPEPVVAAPKKNSDLLADELGILHKITKPTLKVTEEEITLCATIIQLEVMGATSKLYSFDDITEKYWEMLSVAQCIRNRAESGIFPDSVEGVILQSHTNSRGKVIYQFSPAKVLSQYTPTDEAILAAREVLCEGVTVLESDYYYFCATRIEESFEKNNARILGTTEDGGFDKTVGHLTTFYAGK